jgi:transcriptional regulator with XRE-family HTH domain
MKSEQALFGERLRAAIKVSGYAESPTEIAKLLGRFDGDPATPQAISRWLHGKSMPRQRNIKALARMLRIDPALLQYGGTESARRGVREPRLEYRVSALDQHAMDAFVVLPAKKRKLVREIIDVLTEPAPKR